MSMIDYGAVLFKNGRQQNKSMFMDMLTAVGWVDHPRIRYTDCDCVRTISSCDGPDYLESNCWECRRRKVERIPNSMQGEWENTIGDCRGNPISTPGRIDGNYFVYAGDKQLTVVVYKTWFVILVDGVNTMTISESDFIPDAGRRRKSVRFDCAGVRFHVRRIGNRQYWLKWSYKGDHYNVVYGYGIDPDVCVWDRVKDRYCGKRVARRVDGAYRTISSVMYTG